MIASLLALSGAYVYPSIVGIHRSCQIILVERRYAISTWKSQKGDATAIFLSPRNTILARPSTQDVKCVKLLDSESSSQLGFSPAVSFSRS